MSAEILPFGADAPPRPRPANIEAEQSLLGAIFVDPRAFHAVSDRIKADHFCEPVHGRIYAAIEVMILAGRVANPVTLKGAFDRDPALADLGGAKYLVRLAASAVTTINAVDYAGAIIECWKRRRLVDIAERMIEAAADEGIERSADSAVLDVEEAFHELSSVGQPGSLAPLRRAVDSALATAERGLKSGGMITGLGTGLVDLDEALGGLAATDLVIIAGRPSMGKTALATTIARNVAGAGKSVGFFSLEMSDEQQAQRILAGETGVSANDQRRGNIGAHAMASLIDAASRVKDLPLYIDDSPGLSVPQVRARAIRLQRRHGLALLVIDYLQLMVGGKAENRVQEVSAITKALKELAKSLRVPVVALSQLSRAVESREDKRPQLSDLRESGTIEQDADVVMFCYRDEYYLDKSEPQRGDFDDEDRYQKKWNAWSERRHQARGVAELLIRKNRHGPTSTVRLRFDGVRTRFENLARGE